MSPLDRLTSDRLKRLARRARTLAVVYFVAIFTATHVPLDISLSSSPMGWMDHADKLVHLGLYAVLTLVVLAGWELTIREALQAKHYFAVWLVGTVYGMVDEATQIPVGRTGDMHDWLADVVGIILGLVAFRACRGLLYSWLAKSEPVNAK